jgi:formylglycine-generating enzyme required for sulfatase activity
MMGRGWGLFYLLIVLILACDSNQVEQIKVEVPQGVTVPEGMVYIPAGEFIMGHADEPRTLGGIKVKMPAFFIDRYEVSREQYGAYDKEYPFDEKFGVWPAAYVTWEQAQSYCKAQGGQLPTEAHWEKTARGTDGRKWPWLVYIEHPNNGFSGFIPEKVDKRPEWISPYGVYGMGHNVWEWTRDTYTYEGQPEAEKDLFKTIRGGVTQTHITIKFSPTYARNWMDPKASFNFIGFRCVREIKKG